jgi:hypothetical protein
LHCFINRPLIIAATRDGVGHGSRNRVRYDAAWEPETAFINKKNY